MVRNMSTVTMCLVLAFFSQDCLSFVKIQKEVLVMGTVPLLSGRNEHRDRRRPSLGSGQYNAVAQGDLCSVMIQC